MDASRSLRIGLLFSFVLLAGQALVHAQATRTWISGVGDDVNPCSRTAPCKTFAGAISKTAAGGEINCLDPGGFGTVTITKSITLDCRGTFGSVLASSTNGIVVNGAAANVRIRGVAINGAGTTPGINGIRIVAAARVYVEETVIDGFSNSGISVDSSSDVKVSVLNTSIRNNTTFGITSTPGATSEILVWNSSLTGNGTAINAGPNSTFRLSRNAITGNNIGLAAQTRGKILSFRDNSIDGNVTNGAPTGTIALQ